MTGDAPKWQGRDPSGSLRRQAEWLNEKARETFLTDKFHTEIFFLYRADGQGAIAQPPADMDRDQFVAMLKKGIKSNDIFGVLHVVEAWTYFPRRPNDHTMKQVMHGEIAVSELNPGDRTEALMVRCEGRDGYSMMWLSPIIRTPTGVALADPMEMPDPPQGRFSGLFAG
jgi:hypothetical protein